MDADRDSDGANERGERASEEGERVRRKWEQCGVRAVTLVEAHGFCSLHNQAAGWPKRAHEGGGHKPA
jgi:hypothetical protein